MRNSFIFYLWKLLWNEVLARVTQRRILISLSFGTPVSIWLWTKNWARNPVECLGFPLEAVCVWGPFSGLLSASERGAGGGKDKGVSHELPPCVLQQAGGPAADALPRELLDAWWALLILPPSPTTPAALACPSPLWWQWRHRRTVSISPRFVKSHSLS